MVRLHKRLQTSVLLKFEPFPSPLAVVISTIQTPDTQRHHAPTAAVKRHDLVIATVTLATVSVGIQPVPVQDPIGPCRHSLLLAPIVHLRADKS